jgi:hypothetical protein
VLLWFTNHWWWFAGAAILAVSVIIYLRWRVWLAKLLSVFGSAAVRGSAGVILVRVNWGPGKLRVNWRVNWGQSTI